MQFSFAASSYFPAKDFAVFNISYIFIVERRTSKLGNV